MEVAMNEATTDDTATSDAIVDDGAVCQRQYGRGGIGMLLATFVRRWQWTSRPPMRPQTTLLYMMDGASVNNNLIKRPPLLDDQFRKQHVAIGGCITVTVGRRRRKRG